MNDSEDRDINICMSSREFFFPFDIKLMLFLRIRKSSNTAEYSSQPNSRHQVTTHSSRFSLSREFTPPISSTMQPPATISSSNHSQSPYATPHDHINLMGDTPDIKCCKCGSLLNKASALYTVVCTNCYHTKCGNCVAG